MSEWVADYVRTHTMGHVRLMGAKPFADTMKAVGRALVLVSPSVCYETFGRTIIEAFATGTPVLVSDIGAGASLVRDGVTGRHFETGNAEDLVGKARQMAADPGRLSEWGANARQEYLKKYSADTAYESLMWIYEGVVGDGR